MYRMVRNKLLKVLHFIHFWSIHLRISFLHQSSTKITVDNDCYQWKFVCCEWIKYSLLSSWKWLHVTATVCGRTERITQWPSCRQMFLTSLSHQTSYLTHPIQIPWITQFWSLTAAGILSEGQGRWPSETSPEQLLGDDQRRTDQQWPVV